jgi:hypothetical protein
MSKALVVHRSNRQKTKKQAYVRPVLTKNDVLFMAATSIRITGGLDYFWNIFRRAAPASPSIAEARQILADNNDLIFRRARKVTSENSLALGYETACWGSRSVEGNQLYNWRSKVISKQPLIAEIPECLSIIGRASNGNIIKQIYLLQHIVRDFGTAGSQPVFKVLVEYLGRRGNNINANLARMQLFIVGRDRHTHEPFALGVPNGFIDQSIDTCLRWTMNLHKGDTVNEV